MGFVDVGLAAVETVKVNSNGRKSVEPYMVLGYENEELNALKISGCYGKSLVDIGRQATGDEGKEPVYDWGEGIADSFKSAYENSELDFESSRIHTTGKGSLTGRVDTELGSFRTDYGTAALAGILTDADFKMEETVIENLEQPQDVGIENATGIIPVNCVDYEPQPVGKNIGEYRDWSFQGRVKGSIELPRSNPQEIYNGSSYTTGEDVYANIIENGKGKNRALLFEPVSLSDYSWKQFEFDSNQNAHFLEEPLDSKYLQASEVQNHLLEVSDAETRYSTSVEEVGWVNVSETLNGDTEVERAPILRPEEVHLEIDDELYDLPANLQSVVPVLTENLRIESDPELGWDKMIQ